MKRVMDNYDVAHAWANSEMENGRTPNGNLFFEGDVIYSYGYHFAIAKRVSSPTGRQAVLVTERKCSKTTSAHTSLVRSAASHIEQFIVPLPAGSPEAMFNTWTVQIKALAERFQTAPKPEKVMYEIRVVFERVRTYAGFFGLEIPELLMQAGQLEGEEQYNALLKKETALRKAEEKAEHKARLRRQQQDLREWRAFKRSTMRTADGFDYLRIMAGDARIETTQSVEIPFTVAEQFYHEILQTVADGGCTECGKKLMNRYDVLEINARFVRVGCHKVSLKEINKMAQKLGW